MPQDASEPTVTGAAAKPAVTAPLSQTDDGPVRTLTLDDAARRNPLSEEMMAALQGALCTAGGDHNVRAVVIAANGPAFSAGHDLRQLTARRSDPDGGRAYFSALMTACAQLMQAVVHAPIPVIAAVEGVASAAGCQLVASCDLAVAGANARFCTPGVNIGLFCSTPMVALSRNVSRKAAMEMLLLGEMADASTAREHGLVNKVVEPGEALGEAQRMAGIIASKARGVTAIGKEAFYRQLEMPLADAYAYAGEVMVRNMLEADAREGIGAFLDKRAPTWSDNP
ncbi:MAG: enoyl-CoA hydratase [Pseudomonadota bacterium]